MCWFCTYPWNTPNPLGRQWCSHTIAYQNHEYRNLYESKKCKWGDGSQQHSDNSKKRRKKELIFVESVRSQTNKQTNESTCRACQYMWIQCDKMKSHEINCNAIFGESISSWKYKACV